MTEGDYARPNASRTRAVCAFRRSERVIECNGTVGTFLPSKTWIGLSTAFEQGADGVWRPSKFGHAPARRRLGLPPRGAHDLALTFEELGHEVKSVPPLPAKVVCPECHRERILDAGRLGVETPPYSVTREAPKAR